MVVGTRAVVTHDRYLHDNTNTVWKSSHFRVVVLCKECQPLGLMKFYHLSPSVPLARDCRQFHVGSITFSLNITIFMLLSVTGLIGLLRLH